MNFNRRGPDRRHDRPDRPDRTDRPNRPDRDRYARPPQTGGDWQPRERPAGGNRPYQPRGGAPSYQPRPRFDAPRDEGAMSIRLDPRRVGTLKQLAADANVRPGDLVRQWVEERIDAARHGSPSPAASSDLASRLAELTARVAALESMTAAPTAPAPPAESVDEPAGEAPAADAPAAEAVATVDERPTPRVPRKRVTASPSESRVALHDEMIAVLSERGPMSAAELAAAVAERGRYTPPRSGKPLDAAMISQRVSNPVYRARFTRNEGRIGLAEGRE